MLLFIKKNPTKTISEKTITKAVHTKTIIRCYAEGPNLIENWWLKVKAHNSIANAQELHIVKSLI